MTDCREIPLPEKTRLLLPSGETIENAGDAIVIRFLKKRNLVSTSWLNGGFRRDLAAVFNHRIPLAACDDCHANGRVKDYLGRVALSLSLDPAAVCGLITRAEMRNAAIASASYLDLSVTAVVTAGIDRNGGRAGDPASCHECDGKFEPVGGTINTILVLGADLPEYAMTRAVMTATEAKAAALQQLMARSVYSSGIATGSGTDMIAVVADPGSAIKLTSAGKHSVLGELIGRTVIRATTLALERETGLSAESQRNVLVRLARFGVKEDDIWNVVKAHSEQSLLGNRAKKKFMECLQQQAREPERVALVSAILHIADETGWGLLPEEEASRAASRLIHNGFGTECPGISDDELILPHLTRALGEAVLQKIREEILW